MDEIETLWQQGFETGVAGLRTRCPEAIYQYEDHSLRDAWIEGYQAGKLEYRKRKGGYDLGDIHLNQAVKGKLWIESKDAYGFIILRDCEGGTILAKLQIDPEPRVLIPKQNMSPEMALIASKAVAKAASMAYRIEQDRIYHPATRDELQVRPYPAPQQTGALPSREETDRLFELWGLSLRIQRGVKKLYWHMRQRQATNEMHSQLHDQLHHLIEQFDDISTGDRQ